MQVSDLCGRPDRRAPLQAGCCRADCPGSCRARRRVARTRHQRRRVVAVAADVADGLRRDARSTRSWLLGRPDRALVSRRRSCVAVRPDGNGDRLGRAPVRCGLHVRDTSATRFYIIMQIFIAALIAWCSRETCCCSTRDGRSSAICSFLLVGFWYTTRRRRPEHARCSSSRTSPGTRCSRRYSCCSRGRAPRLDRPTIGGALHDGHASR